MNPSYALWRDFHPIEKEDVRSVTSEGMSEQVVAVEDVGQVPARPFAGGSHQTGSLLCAILTSLALLGGV